MEEKSDKRQQIMDLALGLFARRGYDAVGVQEIVVAAGVTKPTLYHYFESKAGLLQSILDEHSETLLNRMRVAATYEGDVPRSLETMAFALVRAAELDPVFYRFMLSLHFAGLESEAGSAGQRVLVALQTIFTGLFQAASPQLGNMQGRAALFAASYAGVLNTWVGLCLNGQVELTEETVRSVVKQFMHGIYS